MYNNGHNRNKAGTVSFLSVYIEHQYIILYYVPYPIWTGFSDKWLRKEYSILSCNTDNINRPLMTIQNCNVSIYPFESFLAQTDGTVDEYSRLHTKIAILLLAINYIEPFGDGAQQRQTFRIDGRR